MHLSGAVWAMVAILKKGHLGKFALVDIHFYVALMLK